MTASHPIDVEKLLADQLASASPDLLRSLLSTFIHALMSAEADALCGAGYGERSEARSNRRNGYRQRDFDTRAGTFEVAIPKLRQGSYFPEWLLARRKRAERALTSVVATCYLLGVSTRRMERLVESLGVQRFPSRRCRRWPKSSTRRSKRFAPAHWMLARTRSWPPTRWCSRCARQAGWSGCTR